MHTAHPVLAQLDRADPPLLSLLRGEPGAIPWDSYSYWSALNSSSKQVISRPNWMIINRLAAGRPETDTRFGTGNPLSGDTRSAFFAVVIHT